VDEGFNKCPNVGNLQQLDDDCDGFTDNKPGSFQNYDITPTCKV
jgi:hypothetical protein